MIASPRVPSQLAAFSVALFAAANVLGATIGLSDNVFAFVNDGGPAVSSGHALVPGPELTTQLLLAPPVRDGIAIAGGTVQFGSISASVEGDSSQGLARDDTHAQYTGIWQDSFTATSATLPVGTLVDYAFTMMYELSLRCLVNGDTTGQFQTVAANVGFQAGTGSAFVQGNSCNTALIGTREFDQIIRIGATIQLEGQMNISADDNSGFHSIVDPPTSFFIDPITPGASYVTGSGTSYLSPTVSVPEPATLALLCIGLAGISVSSRRKQ